MISKKLLLAVFVLFSVFAFSQTQNKIYHYTFSGILSPEKKTEFENALGSLRFATFAKVRYKSEKNAGELFLETSEEPVKTESDAVFDLPGLKKLISQYGLEPQELQITNKN